MAKVPSQQDPARFDRRRFFSSAASGAAMACAGAALTGCSESQQGDAAATGAPLKLEEVRIAELQQGMQTGAYSSAQITRAYLDRIQQLDRQGPALQSIIEVNPDALTIAAQLDEERRAGRLRGPLHGLPVVLKDNLDTSDRMTTTAGSFALEGSIPSRDAFVARQLRAAGAILLAKANLSEWANFRSNNSSSGWSGRGGQCKNPYDLTRNPCGSSSGSAAAVSANLAVAAIGTETNGSIVCPASACGIVGIKPTVGLVGRSGIVPISHTQDTAGPMARTVRDATLVLGALTGTDPRDSATLASQGKSHQDYTRFLDRDGLRGARIGIVRQTFGFHPEVDRIMEESIQLLQQSGAETVDEVKLPGRQEYEGAPFQVLLYEFKEDLNRYLSDLAPDLGVRSLADIIRFNQENREREMPHFGQELLVMSQEKGPLSEEAYLQALEKSLRFSREEGIDKALATHRLDALLAPTGAPAFKTDHVLGDHFLGGSSSPAARAGYPNITVPAGNVRGLPVGISFFSGAWMEPTLIRIAYAFEQASQARIQPQFLGKVAS